jgi:uncharacterized protein YdbL (DUF1318 family)
LSHFAPIAAALAATLACVTINVYFPEAAIKDLSKQIEDQVQKEAAKQPQQPQQPPAAETPAPPAGEKHQGGSASLLDLVLGATPALAQEVAAPEISSPAIRKIIESRAQRASSIALYKSQGAIGENNRALVEPRGLDKLADLKSRAQVQQLVKAENADRDALFKEIAAAKNVDLAQLPKIQETYAATLRDNARPGEWIQLPEGSWKQK